ncbi:MAG: aldehyde dehydrogenase family protein, partial [Haliea sp.]
MSEYQMIINGQKVGSDATFPVINPATEEVAAQCPKATEAHLEQAVAAARAAFPAWSARPGAERG